MHFSKKTRYGIRLMMELASNYKKHHLNLTQIAERENISMKYLSQIMIPLKRAKLVISTRGPKGGYFLARHPSEITAFDIIKILESETELVDCVAFEHLCNKTDNCSTRRRWKELSDLMSNYLGSVSLESISKNSF